jgi:hypothetical protein
MSKTNILLRRCLTRAAIVASGLWVLLAGQGYAATLDELVAAQRDAMQRELQGTAPATAPVALVAPVPSADDNEQSKRFDDVRVAGIYGVGTTRIADVAIGSGPAIPLQKGKSTGGWVVVDISDADVTFRKKGVTKTVPMGAPVTISSAPSGIPSNSGSPQTVLGRPQFLGGRP